MGADGSLRECASLPKETLHVTDESGEDPKEKAENGKNPHRDDLGRLKKGHPGLPGAGRPKGSVSLLKPLAKKLREELPEEMQAERGIGTTYLDAVVDAALGQAICGNVAMLRDLIDRMDGKPIPTEETVEIPGWPENLASAQDCLVAATAIANAQARGIITSEQGDRMGRAVERVRASIDTMAQDEMLAMMQEMDERLRVQEEGA